MIISASTVWKPRKLRRCDGCGKLIRGATIRLYGAADRGDEPYAVYCHPTPECAGGDGRVTNLLVRYDSERVARNMEAPQ